MNTTVITACPKCAMVPHVTPDGRRTICVMMFDKDGNHYGSECGTKWEELKKLFKIP